FLSAAIWSHGLPVPLCIFHRLLSYLRYFFGASSGALPAPSSASPSSSHSLLSARSTNRLGGLRRFWRDSPANEARAIYQLPERGEEQEHRRQYVEPARTFDLTRQIGRGSLRVAVPTIRARLWLALPRRQVETMYATVTPTLAALFAGLFCCAFACHAGST